MTLEVIGWLGVFVYVTAHATLAFWPAVPPRLYFGANLVASLSVGIFSFGLPSWQAVGVNVFWSSVSLRGLLFSVPGTPLGQRPSPKEWIEDDAVVPDVEVRTRLVATWQAKAFFVLILAASVLSVLALFISIHLGREMFGWIYLVGYCGSYLLFSLGYLSRVSYFAYAAYAALVALPALHAHGNYPGLWLNILWGVLAIPPLVQAFREDRRAQKTAAL
ncbi:MAG: hypothetical protein AAGH83_00855 [Pseudomonadota bacterium]